MSALKIEWLKLSKKKSLKVLFMLYGLIMFALAVIYFMSEKSMGLSLYNNGQFMTSSLKVMMAGLLPFMTIYLAIGAFNTEFSNGTIKNMFLLPIVKSQIYFAKFLSVQSIIGVLLVIQFIFSMLGAVVFESSLSFTSFGSAILEYIGAFIILGLINLIGILLGLIIKSSGLSLLIVYLFYMASSILAFYFPHYQTIAITSIVKNYAFLFHGINVTLLLSAVAYYIIIYISGVLIFEKKEENVCQSE